MYNGKIPPAPREEWYLGSKCTGEVFQEIPEIWGWEECALACLTKAPKDKPFITGDSCCQSNGVEGVCKLHSGK